MRNSAIRGIVLTTSVLMLLFNVFECQGQVGEKMNQMMKEGNFEIYNPYKESYEIQQVGEEPEVKMPDFGDVGGGAGPQVQGGGASERATGNTNEAKEVLDRNLKYGHGSDPHSTGTPGKRIELRTTTPLFIARSEITSSQYSSLAEKYIQDPDSFSYENEYYRLCVQHKREGIKIGSKSDFLDFKENLKKYILDKITNIRSLYAFCKFTDITELESGKYDLGGAPAGWKRFYVNQKDSKWLRDKYHFELRIFQSTWDPQVFVMSFRTIGDNNAARKGVENQRMKIEKARVNIAKKVNQKKLENIFKEIDESLSTSSPSGTKRMYLSYPGRPQNFSEGGGYSKPVCGTTHPGIREKHVI